MKVLFFGKLAERAGREVELHVGEEGCTIADLRLRLAEALPAAADELAKPSNRACIDRSIVEETARVLPGHEVAFVPPLSGG